MKRGERAVASRRSESQNRSFHQPGGIGESQERRERVRARARQNGVTESVAGQEGKWLSIEYQINGIHVRINDIKCVGARLLNDSSEG